MAFVRVPHRIAERVQELGMDLETLVIEALAERLGLDPIEEARAHLELAEKLLEEGRALVDRDPVQASEKLYKAAGECVKALAKALRLEDVLKRVRSRSRWSVTDLEKAVESIADRLGQWLEEAWDRAWALHVWGFHEAKLDSEAVKRRLPYVERIVEETRKVLSSA